MLRLPAPRPVNAALNAAEQGVRGAAAADCEIAESNVEQLLLLRDTIARLSGGVSVMMLPSDIVIMLLLSFAGAVRFEELVDAARQVAQDAGGALELLVQHHAGLPVHCTSQVMG